MEICLKSKYFWDGCDDCRSNNKINNNYTVYCNYTVLYSMILCRHNNVLLPHSTKASDSNPGWDGVCVFSSCLREFSPGSPVSSPLSKDNSCTVIWQKYVFSFSVPWCVEYLWLHYQERTTALKETTFLLYTWVWFACYSLTLPWNIMDTLQFTPFKAFTDQPNSFRKDSQLRSLKTLHGISRKRLSDIFVLQWFKLFMMLMIIVSKWLFLITDCCFAQKNDSNFY